MKRFSIAVLFPLAFGLAACEPEPAGKPVVRTEIGKGAEEVAAKRAEEEAAAKLARAKASVCSRVEFESVALTHCVADPAVHRIATALSDPDGTPFASMVNFAEAVDARNVAFAVNAGEFERGGRPLGYYVQDSERLVELDREDGSGNFYLKPNGVFFGSGGAWQIRTADAFFSTVGVRPEFGTQSGPMLVIDGQLHPEIRENGPSRVIRNGVGVGEDGKAHFVKSEGPLSFGQLARYFRDELKTPNALYLDSNVSSVWDPAKERLDIGQAIGPILVVTYDEEVSE